MEVVKDFNPRSPLHKKGPFATKHRISSSSLKCINLKSFLASPDFTCGCRSLELPLQVTFADGKISSTISPPNNAQIHGSHDDMIPIINQSNNLTPVALSIPPFNEEKEKALKQQNCVSLDKCNSDCEKIWSTPCVLNNVKSLEVQTECSFSISKDSDGSTPLQVEVLMMQSGL